MLGVIKATGYSIFSKYLFKTKGGYLKLLPPMLHPVHLLNRFCKGVAHLLSNICPLPSDYAKYAVQLLQLCICVEHLCFCVFPCAIVYMCVCAIVYLCSKLTCFVRSTFQKCLRVGASSLPHNVYIICNLHPILR